MIRGTFLLRLFFGKTKNLSPFVGALSTISVSKARLGLLNPLMSSQKEGLKLHTREHRTGTGRDGRGGVSNADHLQTLSEERRDGKEARDVTYTSRL